MSNNVFLKLLTTPSTGYSSGILSGLGKGLNFPIVSVLSPSLILPNTTSPICAVIDICLNSTTNNIYFMQGGGIYFSPPFNGSSPPVSNYNKPSQLLPIQPTLPPLTNSLKNFGGFNTVGQYWISSDSLFLLYRYITSTATTAGGYYILYNVVNSPYWGELSLGDYNSTITNYCSVINNIDIKNCSKYITIPPTAPPTTTPKIVSTTALPTTTPNSVSTTSNMNTTPNSVSTTTPPTPNSVSTTANMNTTPNSVSTTAPPTTTLNSVTTTANITTPNSVVNTTPDINNSTTSNISSTQNINTFIPSTTSSISTTSVPSITTSKIILFLHTNAIAVSLGVVIVILLIFIMMKKK